MKKNLIIAAAVLLAACGGNKSQYDATGTFEAEETIISSEVSGRVLSFDANEGDIVEPDAHLGWIDTTMLTLQYRQLKSQRRSLESRRPDAASQTASIESQLTTAKREKTRIENLVRGGAATQKQLDEIEAQIDLLQNQLNASKASLKTTTSGLESDMTTIDVQLEQVAENLRRCHLSAPMKGTILTTYIRTNEMVATGTPLYKIADLEAMILRAYITSAQLTQIKLGQHVAVMADYGDSQHRYDGIVAWISDKSEFTPKTVQTQDERASLVYAVKIRVKNDGYIKIGMSGSVILESEK